jgi:resuscitation-promoting factor RpfA
LIRLESSAVSRLISTLIASLAGLLILAGSPALAGDRPGGGGHHGGGHGGGHPGGGCRGGCGGGGHHGGAINVNVNASATASAYASAGAGAAINARAYDLGQVRGGYGGHGGMIAVGSGGVDLGGHGYGGGYGYVYVSGPGYGPSRPFGYTVHGFGRRYVTTDRCGGCRPPRPRPCDSVCGGYGHGGGHPYPGYGYGRAYGHEVQAPPQVYYERDHRGAYGSSYSSYESYSESEAYGGGYAYGGGAVTGGPQYAPAPPVYPEPPAYQEPLYPPSPYAPPPVTYQPAPVIVAPPAGYYGDLPPGDTGEGRPYRQELPYRQEYGERG